MPISRRRLNAACRIVVAMSKVAHSTMSAATMTAKSVTKLITVKNFLSTFCWSWTVATPGAFSNALPTTSKRVGSESWTR